VIRAKIRSGVCGVRGCSYPAVERVSYEEEGIPKTQKFCRDHLREFLRLRGESYGNLLEEVEMAEEEREKLERYRRKSVLTKEQAREIFRTIWPKAPDEEVAKAAMLCAAYRLNPLMKQVFLIPFVDKKTGQTNWTTVLGINATRTLARRGGSYGYVDGPRVMTKEEQEKVFGYVNDTHIVTITKVRDREGMEAVGYGHWPKNEEPYGKEKGNTKENMAFLRSERQALQRLRPAEMPVEEVEVLPEEFTEIPLAGELPQPEEREELEKARAEIAVLREELEKIRAEHEETKASLERVREEKEALQKRLEEISAAVRGEQPKLF